MRPSICWSAPDLPRCSTTIASLRGAAIGWRCITAPSTRRLTRGWRGPICRHALHARFQPRCRAGFGARSQVRRKHERAAAFAGSPAMKVSVVIPTYNDEGTIAATVESALAQRFEGGFEVIVVNDGSTDGTRGILVKFGDRIRVIDQENAGVSAARNAGIRAAAGEYIALLDGDDTWSEEMLAKTAPVLDRNPACVAVFSDVMEVDIAGMVVTPHYVGPGYAHSPTLDEMLERPWPTMVGAIVIRRETILAIGGFSEEIGAESWGGEDLFAFQLVRERGEIRYVPEVLLRRRLREFRAHYANRLRSRSFEIESAQAFIEFARRFEGLIIFARLTRQHFGARG